VSLYNIYKTESETRIKIDQKLEAAGWQLQDKKQINLYAGAPEVNGVAVREADTATGRRTRCCSSRAKPAGS
jgi:type I site-specific restriction endonuclease